MKKVFTILILLVLISACNKLELPPGYKLMCSIEGGKITLVMPNSKISPSIWNNKADAIGWARHWEKVKDKPYIRESDAYTWEECQ